MQPAYISLTRSLAGMTFHFLENTDTMYIRTIGMPLNKKEDKMTQVHSVLLTARAPKHMYIPSYGPLVSDLKTEEKYNALKQLVRERVVFFQPQILIAKDENDLDVKLMFLKERLSPRANGWTNHLTVTSDDITNEWNQHVSRIYTLSEYSDEFFFISVIGIGRDPDHITVPCYASGALSAANEDDAYVRFKSEKLSQSLEGLEWRGGLAQVLRITPMNFSEVYRSWYREMVPFSQARMQRTKRSFH